MPKIMLVEDDNNLREIYGERLMAEGYEIISAGDGEEALALAVKEKPDLIISDVMMPKISGFDMLDILRQTPETKFTKVIMMTALSQNDDKDRATKLGADKYLVKSQVTLEDVARVVHDMVYEDETPATNNEAETPTDTVVGSVTSEPIAVVEPVAVQQAPITEPAIEAVEMQQPPDQVTEEAQVAEPSEELAQKTAPVNSTEPLLKQNVTNIAAEPEVSSTNTEVASNEQTPATPGVVVSPVNEEVNSNQPVVSGDNLASIEAADKPEPAFDLVANSVQSDTPNTTVNPITGEPTVSNQASQTDMGSSALPQSTESEIDAIAKQINTFEKTVKESPMEHEAPAITPTEQEIIHAQNKADDPTVVQPAVSSGVDLSNSTVPPIVDTANPEPASARKKVISPISEGTETKPTIYDLYEKEMASEAANSPVPTPESGTVLESSKQPVADSQNPITTSAETIADSVPQLETLDTTLVSGITFDDQNNEPQIIPESPLQQNPTPKTVNQPSNNPTAAPAQQTVDPNDPANFAL